MTPETIVHRIGGSGVENLRLKPAEMALMPAGFSVLLGGSAEAAAAQMRRAFPDPVQNARLWEDSRIVGSATVADILAAGFLVLPKPTRRLPNHARIVHVQEAAGFTDENLLALSRMFRDTPTPEPTP